MLILLEVEGDVLADKNCKKRADTYSHDTALTAFLVLQVTPHSRRSEEPGKCSNRTNISSSESCDRSRSSRGCTIGKVCFRACGSHFHIPFSPSIEVKIKDQSFLVWRSGKKKTDAEKKTCDGPFMLRRVVSQSDVEEVAKTLRSLDLDGHHYTA